jgi:AraC family transcriptional activator of pobA
MSLNFISLDMPALVDLQAFYRHISTSPPTQVAGEDGHFNIFEVDKLLLERHREEVTYSRRSFYKISLVSGHSQIHYADRTIEVQDSVLVFTNPMAPYSWELTSENQTGYFCIFTEAFFNRSGDLKGYPVFQSVDHSVILLSALESEPYQRLFARMLEELKGDYQYKYDLLRSLLTEVIHMAQKAKPASGKPVVLANATGRIAHLFLELLERQFPVDRNHQSPFFKFPFEYAEKLNIHVNHLNKALKAATGQTTTQLINARRLLEAKILLRGTNWTVAEIAWSLGFEDPNHFSGFFKRQSGNTPKAYRQKID